MQPQQKKCPHFASRGSSSKLVLQQQQRYVKLLSSCEIIMMNFNTYHNAHSLNPQVCSMKALITDSSCLQEALLMIKNDFLASTHFQSLLDTAKKITAI
jgi:hypothetical protein